MKLNTKSIAVVATLCTALAYPLVNSAVAAPKHDRMERGEMMKMHGKHHKMKRLARYLELTDAQKAQAKAIHETTKEQMKSHRAMLKSFREEMHTLIQADSFDEQAVLALKAKYKDTFDQIEVLKAKSKFDFLHILTAEQKAKLADLQAKFKGREDEEPEE